MTNTQTEVLDSFSKRIYQTAKEFDVDSFKIEKMHLLNFYGFMYAVESHDLKWLIEIIFPLGEAEEENMVVESIRNYVSFILASFECEEINSTSECEEINSTSTFCLPHLAEWMEVERRKIS